jgi:toxin ParE1/3/4
MSLVLDLSDEAKADALEIGNYISARNLTAARKFAFKLNETYQLLLDFPDSGERLSSDPTGKIRIVLVSGFKNYLIFFRREGEMLQVLRVLHGARDYSKLFD